MTDNEKAFLEEVDAVYAAKTNQEAAVNAAKTLIKAKALADAAELIKAIEDDISRSSR